MNTCCECNPCTKHIWSPEKQAFIRCPKVNPSIFFSAFTTLPAKFLDSKWEDFNQSSENRKESFRLAKQLVQKVRDGGFPKKSLIFTGDNLEGPYLLAALILKEFIVDGLSCSRVSLSELTNNYFSDKAQYFAVFKPKILLVELGSEIANASSLPIISELFKERSFALNYTFFISRFNLIEFTTKFSKELFSFFSTPAFKEFKC